MTLIERVEDLLKQATTEKSHNYTASVLEDVLQYLRYIEHENKTTNMQKYAITEGVGAVMTECKAILRSINKENKK